MKKLMVFLALSFAICSFSFGQSMTKGEPQKVDHSGIKQKQKHDDGKGKSKYNKHKHKHKHKHMHHMKKHGK